MPYSDDPNADPADDGGIEMSAPNEEGGGGEAGPKGEGGWRSMPTETETPLSTSGRKWVLPAIFCGAAAIAAAAAAAVLFVGPTWRPHGGGGGAPPVPTEQPTSPRPSIPQATLKDGPRFEVLSSIPHDPSSFTQGLTYADGVLYESTGLYRQSKVRKLDPETGDVLQSVNMEGKYFGEGMAYHDGKLVQITWKLKKGYVYDASNLEVLRKFTYKTTNGEGWGITHQPEKKRFVVSDGSPYLHFWDEETLEDLGGKVKITRQGGGDAKNLNELEYWRGKILANVWYEDAILVINPDTGEVESEFDFSTLKSKADRRKERADVLNGISVSEEEDVLFFTGKKWNTIYRVRLV